MEPVPAGIGTGRRPDQHRIRTAGRNHGQLGPRPGSVQLLGAGHRQHGSAGALRQRGAEARVAGTVAARRNPFGLRHDRAGCGLVRCHQHGSPRGARGRRVGHQRTQVVDLRRLRPALQDHDLYGSDQPGCTAPRPALDDPGADGYSRRQGAAPAAGVRLRRRPARPRGSAAGKRAGTVRERHPR